MDQFVHHLYPWSPLDECDMRLQRGRIGAWTVLNLLLFIFGVLLLAYFIFFSFLFISICLHLLLYSDIESVSNTLILGSRVSSAFREWSVKHQENFYEYANSDKHDTALNLSYLKDGAHHALMIETFFCFLMTFGHF